MLPPKNVWKATPILPRTERERTVIPRATPSVRVTRKPAKPNAVVTKEGCMKRKLKGRRSISRGAKEEVRGLTPAVAFGPGATRFAQTTTQGAVADEPFKRGGELGGVMRRNEQTRDTVRNRFRHAPHRMCNDGQTMRSRFQIDQTEALDAMTVFDTRHREDIGVVVNVIEFIVGKISKKPHRQVRMRHRGAKRFLIPPLI